MADDNALRTLAIDQRILIVLGNVQKHTVRKGLAPPLLDCEI